MSNAKHKALKEYRERTASQFKGKKGIEKYNDLSAEGRVRSGVHFSYAKQDFTSTNKHLKKGNLRYLGHKK